MNIEKTYNEKELTLTVDGRIDTVTSAELESEINEELGNFESLTLDFENLEYISSAGLRVLIATQKELKPKEIPFIIKNLNDEVNEVFEMSGFSQIFEIK